MTTETNTEPERRERNRTKVNWRGKLMTARGSFDAASSICRPAGRWFADRRARRR